MKNQPAPPITSGILKWARQEAGLSLAEAAKRAKIGALKPKGEWPGVEPWERLHQWEEGLSAPSYQQLCDVAKAYRRPVLTFFLPRPPRKESKLADFRTVGDKSAELNSSPEFAALIRKIEALHMSVKELLLETASAPVAFVGSGNAKENVRTAVATIREQLRFPFSEQQKIRNGERLFAALRTRIEKLGIFVMLEGNLGSHHTAILPDVFRGVVFSDKIAPFIVINPNDAPAARVFSLVHELVHLWLGDTGVSNLDHLAKATPDHMNNEHFCNKLTAEFLVPAEIIMSLWSPSDEEDYITKFISKSAKKFKVSEICVARRLLDIRLISPETYWYFYELYVARLRRDRARRRDVSGGPDPKTQNVFRLGGRLIATIIDAAQEGRISELDASQLLRVKINKFSDIYPGAM